MCIKLITCTSISVKLFFITDCSAFAAVMPSFTLSGPRPFINVNDNVTLQCTASSITKNALLYWIVDGIPYNTTGTFSTSRGQLMVEQPLLDAVDCRISSSLTVFNVQLNSQCVYNCVVQDINFTLSMGRLIMLNVQSSNEGTYV